MSTPDTAPKRTWLSHRLRPLVFTAVTWNCLAQSRAAAVAAAAGVPDAALAWEHRVPMLARELWHCLQTEEPASVPAVLVLQEVDEACVDSLVAAARLQDYERFYVRSGAAEDVANWQRKDAVYAPLESGDGGMLVLHNLARFYREWAPVESTIVRYRCPHTHVPQPERGVVMTFGTWGPVVMATQLKAGANFWPVRAAQLEQLMSAAKDAKMRVGVSFHASRCSALLLGCLNERDGGSLIDKITGTHGFTDVRVPAANFGIDGDWHWTAAATRASRQDEAVADYMFVSDRVGVDAVLGRQNSYHGWTPPPAQLFLAEFPSDHIPLAAVCRI